MKTTNPNNSTRLTPFLWAALLFLALGLLFARAVFSDQTWLTVATAVPLIGVLAALVAQNQKALRTRSAQYGINSAVTSVLVIAIVCVLNFLAARYPYKMDLTKNKLHTLSDQTVKLIKGLQKPVKAVFFSKTNDRESVRPLLENLKGLNPKFEVEYVDPYKEPTRTKQVGIKKDQTLQLIAGTRDSKVETVTEEKVTNALIKLLKDKTQTLCALTGHGERNFSGADAEGYDGIKKALQSQSYEIKDLTLLQETKVPENCDAITILGPNKALFPQEIKAIGDYLANGGRAIIATDMNIKGVESAPELNQLLESWYVRPVAALIVDPLSRMLGVDAAVPVIATYSKDNAITKDFQTQSYFPFARPLEVMTGAPAGLNVQWLGQTTPKSWGEVDMKEISTGAVKLDSNDKQGPLTIAVAVDGKSKDSKAARNTRLVVFGTSHFANNQWARFGGNSDLFLNAVSWVMEDESLISIRPKEEAAGKIELTQQAGTTIFLLTVIIIPLLIAVGGIVIWVYRRKL